MSDETPERGLVPLSEVKRSMYTSLDMTKVENRRRLVKYMQDCDAKLTEQVNLKIPVCDYVMHSVTLTAKDSGEIINATRLVLIDDKGVAYECVAETIIRSLRSIAFAYGPPPYNPPLNLTVKTRKNGERSYYWLEPE